MEPEIEVTEAVTEPVTTETNVAEAGSQSVTMETEVTEEEEESDDSSDDDEERGDFNSPQGSLLDLDWRREQSEGADVSRLSITSRLQERQEAGEQGETVMAQGKSCNYFDF